jgi:hypothetical protein
MKLRTLGMITVAGAAAGAVVWWRRGRWVAAPPPVQLGLSDGSVRSLDPADPATMELVDVAADLRRALETSG